MWLDLKEKIVCLAFPTQLFNIVAPKFWRILWSYNHFVSPVISVARIYICYWVNSGKFRHQVNLDTHLQTVLIQMRGLHISRLIWIYTVCLVNLFFSNIWNMNLNKQGCCPNLAVCPNIPDFILVATKHNQNLTLITCIIIEVQSIACPSISSVGSQNLVSLIFTFVRKNKKMNNIC